VIWFKRTDPEGRATPIVHSSGPEQTIIDVARRFDRVVAEAIREGFTVPQIAGLTGFDPYEIGQAIDRYNEREKETP